MGLSGVEKRYLQTVGLLSGLCLGLFIFRLLSTGVSRYWFVPENLALAWIALMLGWILVRQVETRGWRNWRSLVITGLWLLFLPNAWYVMTDFIHVFDSGEISYLYDIGMITVLTMTGFLLGFTSLFMVHRQLLKRLDVFFGALLIEGVILLVSFAIYLGRDLRWNTWDIFTNPSGLILSITDRLINPFGFPRALNVTTVLFIIISVVYFAVWQFLRPVAYRRT